MIELRRIYLESPSVRHAFYQLTLFEMDDGTYLVIKKSGADGRVLNVRSWPKDTKEEAERRFEKTLHQKTSLTLKRRRHYRVVQKFP